MIEIKNLTKKYGSRTVLDKVNLSIESGEIFGLLGPNGAGKTTLIRIITMLAKHSGGTITVNKLSLPAESRKIKALLGCVPQHLNLDSELTAWENLELHGRLHHMPASERWQRIDELLEYVGLRDRAAEFVNTFSGGMKRRLMIARALMHRPKILFMDEPTVGLDPQVRRRLWDLILNLNHQGLTVLLTTHYIEEAEALCKKVAILDKGRLIMTGTPAELRQRVGKYVLEWTETDGIKTCFFNERTDAIEHMNTLNTNTTLRNTNLEDVFVELTGRKVKD